MRRQSIALAVGLMAIILIMVSAAQSADNAAANLANLFSEKWAGYEIRYPSAWVLEKPKEFTVLFAGRQGTDDYYTTVTVQNVASTKSGGRHQNVGSLVSSIKQQFKTGDPQARIYNEGTMPFTSEEGTPVQAVVFECTYRREGTDFQQWAVIVPRASDRVYHVFFYTSPVKFYDRNIKTAREMLATFRLTKENR
ncbi:MAG: hypothetical protein ABFD82_12705 [Syntrophaceae bacterium]